MVKVLVVNHLRKKHKKGAILLAVIIMVSAFLMNFSGSVSANWYESDFVTEYNLAEHISEVQRLRDMNVDITPGNYPEGSDPIKVKIVYILNNSVISITIEEYFELCFMAFCESGFCSWEMQNGCASAAINQAIQEGKTIHEVLNSPKRFREGDYTFKDYQNENSYITRKVQVSDLTPQLYDAVNTALLGYDINSEIIGDTIGFWAPNYCSDSTNQYFYRHVNETTQVENVHFFSEWV